MGSEDAVRIGRDWKSQDGTVKLTDLRIYSASWTLPKLLILRSSGDRFRPQNPSILLNLTVPLESQVGPLPRVGLYARVSTPHQHTIGMQLRQLREFLERRRWQEVLVVEEVASGSRRGVRRETVYFRDQRPRLE